MSFWGSNNKCKGNNYDIDCSISLSFLFFFRTINYPGQPVWGKERQNKSMCHSNNFTFAPVPCLVLFISYCLSLFISYCLVLYISYCRQARGAYLTLLWRARLTKERSGSLLMPTCLIIILILIFQAWFWWQEPWNTSLYLWSCP